jgi:hypothetical protein
MDNANRAIKSILPHAVCMSDNACMCRMLPRKRPMMTMMRATKPGRKIKK